MKKCFNIDSLSRGDHYSFPYLQGGRNVCEISERDIILQALEDFNSLNIDYVDTYIASWMKMNQIEKIATHN